MNTEVSVRLGFFFGVFIMIALWERAYPRRIRALPALKRWPNNLGITLLNSAIVRLALPFLAVDMALLTSQRGWGLLNSVIVSHWSAVLIGFIILDLTLYLQHILFHAVPVLWRFHMVHHADLDIDVTTGLRFHPVEIVLSMGIKIAVILLIGPPVLSVVIFEIVLNATSMFNHGNITIPEGIDRFLRYFVVTPDMHRVHHSVVIKETNSNFGFNLPWWDRILGTYRMQPAAGHQKMVIGLSQFREARQLTFPRLIILPFTGPVGDYPMGMRS